MICKICNREIASHGMPSHLRRTHKITQKDYYDTYIEPNVEHKCICGNDTSFFKLTYGYRIYCCQDCARRHTLELTKQKYNVTNISQVAEVNAKMRKGIKDNWDNLTEEQYKARCNSISIGTTKAMQIAMPIYQDEINKYCLDNNLIKVTTLESIYGSGFIQSTALKEIIHIQKYKNVKLVSIDDIDIKYNFYKQL